ncbi:hypothetical protein V5N11_013270 [Cardamine amara subsp. amara]|uniref:DUF8040 domain-containing protein n=1 Tax=Cardamine amara subsp. amara TaxID=228776 RepID=A0ABD0ZV35_CARAN
MEHIVEERAELHDRKTIEREDDESDLNIMLLLLENLATTSTPIECPIRRTVSNVGYNYIQNALTNNSGHFQQFYHMGPNVFHTLCDVIRVKTWVRDTRYICVE